MNLLLDTHIFLWWLKNDKKLSQKGRRLIQDANQIYISSASIWEAAIKIHIKKLSVKMEDLVDSIESEGFQELPINITHAATTLKLPYHHRDPFDRMLIAQALTEPLKLLTTDKMLVLYSDSIELI